MKMHFDFAKTNFDEIFLKNLDDMSSPQLLEVKKNSWWFQPSLDQVVDLIKACLESNKKNVKFQLFKNNYLISEEPLSLESLVNFEQLPYSYRINNIHLCSHDIFENCLKLNPSNAFLSYANLYVVKKNEPIFDVHSDPAYLFVEQIEGKRAWQLTPLPKSKRFNSFYTHRKTEQMEEGGYQGEMVLTPKSLLFLPFGCFHKVNSPKTSFSIHITYSLYPSFDHNYMLSLIKHEMLKNCFPDNLKPLSEEDVSKSFDQYLQYLGEKKEDLKNSLKDEFFKRKAYYLKNGSPNG